MVATMMVRRRGSIFATIVAAWACWAVDGLAVVNSKPWLIHASRSSRSSSHRMAVVMDASRERERQQTNAKTLDKRKDMRKPRRRGVGDSVKGVLAASAVICLASALTAEVSVASYAPSSAAVTSSLPPRKVGLEEFENLNAEKALQQERALGVFNVENLISQLDLQLERLQNQISEIEQSITKEQESSEVVESQDILSEMRQRIADKQAERDARRAEVEQALALKKKFENELRTRAETLRKLEAQPSWFNYFAAAAASVVSTLIMHPVDTIKTTSMISVSAPPTEEEEEESKGGDDDGDGGGRNGFPVILPESFSHAQAVVQRERELVGASTSSSQQGSSPATTSGSSSSRDDSSSTLLAPISTAKSVVDLSPKKTNGVAPADDDEPTEMLETSKTNMNPLEYWASLYVGIGGNVAKEALPSALYLGVYEAAKTFFVQKHFPLLLAYLIAGGAGEMCGSVIRAPAEAVKSLSQSGLANSFGDACVYIVESPESRKRVLRAWVSSVLRDVPMGAIQIAIFEGLKLYILNSPVISIDVNTLQAEAAIGAIGGMVGAYLTTPTDITTTRIITAPDDDTRGPLDHLVDIWKNEGGFFALFQGGFQRSLYWAPAIGIFLSCYCSIRQYATDSPAAIEAIEIVNNAINNYIG